MPEKTTLKRAAQDRREGKSPSTQAGEFVREEMEHIRRGKHGALAQAGDCHRPLQGTTRRCGFEAAQERPGFGEDAQIGGARLPQRPLDEKEIFLVFVQPFQRSSGGSQTRATQRRLTWRAFQAGQVCGAEKKADWPRNGGSRSDGRPLIAPQSGLEVAIRSHPGRSVVELTHLPSATAPRADVMFP